MTTLLLARGACVVALVTAAIGCGNDPYATVAVQGLLTCQQKPIPHANVLFTPLPGEGRSAAMTGKPARGETDADGRFTLGTFAEQDGAIVGQHRVEFDVTPETGPCPCSGRTTEVTVPPGGGEITVAL